MLKYKTAYSSFAVIDLTEALKFYKDILMLEVEKVNERFFYLYLDPCDVHVVFQKNEHIPSNSAVLNFEVYNLKQTVLGLKDVGIIPVHFDKPFETDDDGISWDPEGSHLAWITDPSGNIITLIEN